MARTNNGRNSRRKTALNNLQIQLANGGYTAMVNGDTVQVKYTEDNKARIRKEMETLLSRVHN